MEDADEVRVPIAMISRGKVILDSEVSVPSGTILSVTLEIDHGPTFELSAKVMKSGCDGLFMQWQHEEESSESDLAHALIDRQGVTIDAADAADAEAKDSDHAADVDEPGHEEGDAAETSDPEDTSAKDEEAEDGTPDESAEATPESPASAKKKPTGKHAHILSRAHKVRSSDLAAKHDNVNVMTMTTITDLIQEAVNEAVQNADRAWDEDQRKSLLEEAEEAFNERMEAMKAEKAGLEAQTSNLQDQLGRAQSLLEEEKMKVLEVDQFTVSDAGMAELDRRLGRLLERACVQGGISGEAEQEMRDVVSRLLDDEREKIKAKAEDAQSDAIELLNRKVDRLAKTLQDAEKARRKAERRASALEAAGAGGAFQNLYTAGLDDDDPDKEKKLDLLKELIEDNRDVRAAMKEAGTVVKGRQKPAEASAGDDVKKISIKRVAPPPLERATP